MTARSNFFLALLSSLACLPGAAEATAFQAPVKAFGPEDEVRLATSERVQLEMTACFEWAAERRELAVTYRVSEDQSLLAFVRCHGRRDSEGQIPVNEIRCKKEAAAAWQCEHHYTYYRIDFGKSYVLAADAQMSIEVPGESPDRSSEAMAAILASEPRRLHGKYCDLPRYRDGIYEIECEGVQYAVKRTCDYKGCRHAVRRK
jgi:hypothetical protein